LIQLRSLKSYLSWKTIIVSKQRDQLSKLPMFTSNNLLSNSLLDASLFN
jgi:hypothetical protein